ncbi:hypothetical protein CDA63_07975 [Hymenobacter amundsenii]|uniref:Uncharacterized protein n=1 Tax=Hymenobacter amundsenii TaxID=2006685 RepID=A0A246FLT8_9BACT|nr:hypothetical protein [Hymenobacter amundsenii]OWP63715.1 hypothetical protein CDA63_07975 [Hymenobacter amundsenii]
MGATIQAAKLRLNTRIAKAGRKRHASTFFFGPESLIFSTKKAFYHLPGEESSENFSPEICLE